jgi:phosphoribosylamine---glycine ligase
MKVALIGSGGREHALAWKIKQSPMVKKLYVLPGNGGISDIAECVYINVDDIVGIVHFCKEEKIELVMIGPEAPLSKGLAETLRSHGIPAVGPDSKCAMLECSKVWSKDFMVKHGIPTASYRIVTDKETLFTTVEEFGFPVVIKMDGLCAGKGVFICKNIDELKHAAEEIYGVATGSKSIVEQFLEGQEASYMFFTDGESYIPLLSSRDHKKAFDDDKGPNTGGMGAVSPAPISSQVENKIIEAVVEPTLSALKNEGLGYNGIIYAGLMINDKGDIKVLEFNARFGDPETQVILTRMDSDIMDILVPLGTVGKLPSSYKIKWKDDVACCVVMAEEGYPGTYEKGEEIPSITNTVADKDEYIFHAGTVKKEGKYYVNGGRVLGVTALGSNLEEARKKAYALVDKLKWKTAYYRKDIGIWR